MDNQVSTKHIPTDFTELFIDISRADEVVALLTEFFNPDPNTDPEGEEDAKGMKRTGAFAFELYLGHRSRFWLSPAYGDNHCLRLDVFWFRTHEQGRESFFQQFWELLREKNIDFRLHWGKYLPRSTSSVGARYLQARYPMWKQFMQVRRTLDPEGLFLNTYWRQQLGIPVFAPAQAPVGQETPRSAQERGLVARGRQRARRGRMHISIRLLKLYFGLIDLVRGRPSGPPAATPPQQRERGVDTAREAEA
jgi:hypothetical protein